ncbi:urate oxidase [Chlorella sorokiniana]|uniref:Uricase n=1 Tax=Chlorella sorokiniana TaxID=3076 RepID=A0A2P6TQE7_CHLSO|nr:urate oxidase [Chlorella sorokiniana]|eukprot:PRW56232.1 urate oxidase [Chlorella sorokiniana]
MAQSQAQLAAHQHGKSRVRLGRVWRVGNVHHFVEFNVATMLESDMEHAFLTDSNRGMTATDTQKNSVYYVAKQLGARPCSPEEFGLALARHFVDSYPDTVWKAKVSVEMMPWRRLDVNGQPHDHGYVWQGSEIRTAYVTADSKGKVEITAGLKDLKVLKTTQSGYSGFLHDKFTTLPDVGDRIVATSVTANWRYSRPPASYDAAYATVRQALTAAFYGPPRGGVFSPSVQFTLYQMGKAAIDRVPEVESVFLNMPNLHFIPCVPVTTKSFDNDVYVATSEPHGNIEAVVTRAAAAPHCRL